MKLSTKDMIVCGIFASITAILSQISIPLPFTTVPLTMQVFAVALSGVILGAKKGFISQIIYIIIGAIGMPVFAQMNGGIGAIVGPTGGFILGFPFMSLVIGYFSEKFKSHLYIVVGMLIGLVIDYAIGTLMFSSVMKMSIDKSLMACVIPFIPVDLLKIGLATMVGVSVTKRVGVGIKSC